MLDKKKETNSEFSIKYLSDPTKMYLSDDERVKLDKTSEIDMMDLCLFRVDEVCYEEKAPRREALENVLSAMRVEGINFIFLVIGDSRGVNFYYGVSGDERNVDMNTMLTINDIGEYILKPGIEGNFRGSKLVGITPDEKSTIVDRIGKMRYSQVVEGVPGANKDDEKFQSVDRLVDVMLGDEFCYMVIAKPVGLEYVIEIQKEIYQLYSQLIPLSKKTIQNGNTNGTQVSKGTSKSTGKSSGTSGSTTETAGTNDGTSDGTTKTIGTSYGTGESTGTSSSSGSNSSSKSSNKGGSESKATQNTTTKGTSHSVSKQTGTNEGLSVTEGYSETSATSDSTSESTSVEFGNKEIQDWIKYLDDVIIPRLDYGKGKGVYVTSIVMFTNNRACMAKLSNTAISLYAGETGNRVPLKAIPLPKAAENAFKNFRLPHGTIKGIAGRNEQIAHCAMSQVVGSDNSVFLGNWITTNELGVVAGLPQKEVVGLRLKEEVEFGLNAGSLIPAEHRIELGKLVQSGKVLENNPVYLDKRVLDQHIFIAGVTGSGKTTTCQNLLYSSELPFLVIEPAKTEYRILKESFSNLLVFTLGKNNITPLKINPFAFLPHESITSRADMIMACIESAFDMEAAIPQIIETAIYKCYEDYGWDISTNMNHRFSEPFSQTGEAFPTLEDLVKNCSMVVDAQGFDQRLRNDYIGSIKARLQGLMVGSKGFMLNTHQTTDFEELLEKRVVLELEEIRSGSEKSLIMGFLLIELSEAIKAKYIKQGSFRHITLVEEAHRLLSKYQPGDDPNKRHGVEMFADMLAEIRKYGESLIIVDQIPNKLTPEVLKNTNTKIIHRLFAEDDKEAIGNTVMLAKEQKEFLSNLETGRAVFFSNGFNKAVQVQINQSSDTSRRAPEDSELIPLALSFYCKHYKVGYIKGIELFERMPTEEQCIFVRNMNLSGDFERMLIKLTTRSREDPPEKLRKALDGYRSYLGKDMFREYVRRYYFNGFAAKTLTDEHLDKLLDDFITNNSIGIKKAMLYF